MAQPVAKIVVKFNPLDAALDPMSFHLVYVEQTGTSFNTAQANGLGVSLTNSILAGGIASAHNYLPPGLDPGVNRSEYIVTDITTHLDGSPAGPPLAHGQWTCVIPAASNPVPEGVAGVISFNSDLSGVPEFVRDPAPPHKVIQRPRATRRNRIYFPIGGQALAFNASQRCRIASTVMTNLLNWLVSVQTISDNPTGTGNTWGLHVWSKKNAAVYDPIAAHMDDRPDYQRRRTDQSNVLTSVALTVT